MLGEGVQEETAMALSKKLVIGGGLAKKLLPMLAPVILGMLLKNGGKKSSSSPGGGLAGGIGGIVDRDGSILDNIGGMILSGATGKKGASEKREGILQWLLSLIFGRK